MEEHILTVLVILSANTAL